MVVVEGLARELDPAFNMWKTSEPVIGEWIARNLGPAGRIERAAEAAGALGQLVGRIPDLVSRAEDVAEQLHLMSREGVRLETGTAEGIARGSRRESCWQTLALWIGAGALVAIALGVWG